MVAGQVEVHDKETDVIYVTDGTATLVTGGTMVDERSAGVSPNTKRPNFRAPRIEGTFTGGRMRAFDVEWGDTRGSAVIENAYADVTDVVISKDGATVQADGRFSLGYPRRDGGDRKSTRLNSSH